MTRGHRDHTPASAPAFRPEPGPIAVLPRSNDVFVAAAEAGGAVVAPLSADTRGIVWLTYGRSEELDAALSENPGIQWVQLPWAGVDAFAGLLAASRPDIVWTSAKGAYSEPVAEHAVALTLAALRELPQKAHSTSWQTTKTGTSLYGLNVVVVGAGGIAIEILRLFAPFEPFVTVVRRSSEPLLGADRTITAAHLADVLPEADVVILAAASTSDTRHLFGAAEFAAMKPSAVIVNIARGPLIDTDALAAALASGAIAGAGLDVTDPEPLPDGHALWTEPRCLITSHSADTKAMTRPLLAGRIRANTEAFHGDGRFVGVVDLAAGY